MLAETWHRLGEIFDAASKRPPAERAAFLDQACAGEPRLRQEVERLLDHDRKASAFLEEPAFRLGEAPRREAASGEARPGGGTTGAARAFKKGDRLGSYRLGRVLEEGGMGTVFLARRDDDQYQQRVAIKLVRRGFGSTEALRRFLCERQILAHLSHPNIARLLDGGTTEDGLPFLVMELIDGLPITEHCDRYRLSIEERLRLFLDACSAVQYAHQNLLIHRDIKPGNLLVTQDGAVKLLDFGIAKLLEPDRFPQAVSQTGPEDRWMTLDHASPEQVRGEVITTASDVFSLGVLLYELLVGRSPYVLSTRLPHELERAICKQDLEKPSRRVTSSPLAGGPSAEAVSSSRACRPDQLKRRLRGDLDTIVLMALRKEPQRRYGTVAGLARDIELHLAQRPVAARSDTWVYRTVKFVRRNRVAVGLSAAFIAILVLLASGFFSTISAQAQRVARERDRAERVAGFLIDLFSVSDPDRRVASSVTARELLDRGAQRVARDLHGQPLAQATMLDTMGQIYRSLGMTHEAEAMIERALELWREELGESHPYLAGGLHHLALIAVDRGDPERGEALLRQAIETERRFRGDRHPAVARIQVDLANLKRRLYDFAGAEALAREALEIRRNAFGVDDPRVAESLRILGRLLLEKGEGEEAGDLYREALLLQRRALGEHHPAVAAALTELGNLTYSRGQLEDAEGLYRQALAIQREVFGETYPEVADALNTLGGLLGERGRYEEAEHLLRESLKLRRQLYSEDSPYVATVLGNLGQVLRDRGDLEGAAKALAEARAMILRIYGEHHPSLAINSLATARLEHRRGHFERALELYRQSAEISARNLPRGHPYTAYPQVGWSRLLLDRGAAAEAQERLRPALEILRASLVDGHWRIAAAESLLGACLTAQGRYGEAERLLVESYEVLKASCGPQTLATRRARVWLEELRDAQRRL